jgi:hypothetical protein
MERRLIDSFGDYFDRYASPEITRKETFTRAKSEFEKVCGFTPYSNYESYKSARTQSRRKFR